jgi:NADH-quinone oxidoreductase subunit A
MLFILFDIEASFSLSLGNSVQEAWSVWVGRDGVFVVILFVGYIYVWKKGALEWE